MKHSRKDAPASGFSPHQVKQELDRSADNLRADVWALLLQVVPGTAYLGLAQK